MSYAIAEALQRGVYGVLSADAGLTALVGTDIYDAAPATAPVPSLYVSLGPEDVRARNDQTGDGAIHRFTVSVVSDTAGFASAKQVAVAISDALHATTPALTRGRIVHLNFERARARRIGADQQRQIDLRFVARVEDD